MQVHRLGYVQPGAPRRGVPEGRPLPLVQFLVEPGGSIDFADLRTGFHGLRHPPSSERVLRLWSDHVMSVSRGHDWILVIDADRPFDAGWLNLLDPRAVEPSEPRYAAVSVSFTDPTPAGPFRVRELDATTRTALVRIAGDDGDPSAWFETPPPATRPRHSF